MYRSLTLSVLFACFLGDSLYAQCRSCEDVPQYESQYCYTDEAFSDYCAVFNESASYFYLSRDKKLKKIPYGSGDTDYLLSLARDKALKINAEDLLFTQAALQKWEIESRKIGYTFRESGLGIKIIEQGSGELPKENEIVKVHYAGYLEDGTMFDSSYERSEPIEFPLGMGRVIKGWDEGIAALSKGTKAWLYIPYQIAYGEGGKGQFIPPKSTLIFQVYLLE